MPKDKKSDNRLPSRAEIVRSIVELRDAVSALTDIVHQRPADKVRADAMVARMASSVAELSDDHKKTRQRIEEAEEARGRAAETMFRGALPAVLKKAGHAVEHVEPRRLRKKDREYDFVARNGKANYVGEVKVRFRVRHLARLRDLARQFRRDYPAKAGERAVYGIVCGITVDEDAANIAREEGMLVVEAKGKAQLRAKPRKVRNFAKE